jgi:uncharacterized glyoxalase superfamily protein PhnB
MDADTSIDTSITALYPRLVVEGADAALDFYARAFGGSVTERFTDPDGRVVHAVVVAGPARFAVKDAGDGDPAPAGGAVPVIMALEVSDADAVAERMLAGGATVIHELADRGYGYGGRLADPWGHQWMLTQAATVEPPLAAERSG